MLLRKLLLVHGVLVGLLLAAALAAIMLLHGVLTDLDRVGQMAVERVAGVASLESSLTAVKGVVRDGGGLTGASADVDAAMASVRREVGGLEELAVTGLNGGVSEAFKRLRSQERAMTGTGGVPSPEALARFAEGLVAFDQASAAAIDEHRQGVIARFRWTALLLGLVFLVVINVAVMVLSRMVAMVVRPVDALVEASRRLAREDFGHRVELGRRDEFGELARAYNALAEQLQANEQRKLEVLRQVSRTLSHEINNTIAIVEMQLALVVRAAGVEHGQAERLRQIHESLGRISRTAEALSRVRRIVLTDYTAGVSMLDLERSTEEDGRDIDPTEQVGADATGPRTVPGGSLPSAAVPPRRSER